MTGLVSIVTLMVIGTIGGVLSGFFGIGGGVILVPALIFLMGFSQQKAAGTSLAVLILPLGLAAVLEYFQHNFVDLRSALIIAPLFILGAWVGAKFATKLPGSILQLAFGIFVLLLGSYLVFGAVKKLGWM